MRLQVCVLVLVASFGFAHAQGFGGSLSGQSNRCKGECVQYYLCNNDQIITDGTGIIDIRVGEDATKENECPNYLHVCCEKNLLLEVPPPSLTSKAPPRTSDGSTERLPSCGRRNDNGVGVRITGDVNGESQYGEFPWMAAILLEKSATGTKLNLYQCGGSLIAPEVVLTAAHCVFDTQKDQLMVRVGEWDTQTRDELLPHQDERVAEIITHEAFNRGSLANDVALLIMQQPFKLAENVQPICLPPRGTTFDYNNCAVSGWGKSVFGKEGKYQVILKKVELPVVPHVQCQDALRSTRLGWRFVLHQSFLCAGGVAGQDTCRGDGGSPLVCPIPGTSKYYYQAGIVAWGIGCGENGVPGVYGNVAFFRDWIDKKLLEASIFSRAFVYSP